MINELSDTSKILILLSLIIIISDLFAFLAIIFGILTITNYVGEKEVNTSKNKQVNIKYKGKKNHGYLDSSNDYLKNNK